MSNLITAVVAAAVVLACVSCAQADTIIDIVQIGNPGNVGEGSGGSYGGSGPDGICGAVNYVYGIGKYEVTAGQYADFLSAVATYDTYDLYHVSMSWEDGCGIEQTGDPGSYSYSVSTEQANRPVNCVSWSDAVRFANWLHNDQPTGVQDSTTTEDGAYDMSLGADVVRKPGAIWVLPAEDEWYKAAYYDPNKLGGPGYWDYATRSDSAPGRDMTEATNPGNNASYYGSWFVHIDPPYYTTVVGEFELSGSAYGTFDQGGNVTEWNETIFHEDGMYRGIRGGDFISSPNPLLASFRTSLYAGGSSQGPVTGFRVAYIPEPTTLVLLLVGGLVALRRRR